jgi:Zn-dependent protease with chaperone function
MLASLPLAAGALAAARPFARAAVRYRIVAAGYLIAAAVGPVAFVAAVFRTAPAAGSGTVVPDGALAPLLFPAGAIVAALATALLFELAVDVVRLRRVKRAAAPLGSAGVRGAHIGSSPTVLTPTAIGYLHPAVVLPQGFRARVDASEWDAVIAHECAHLARRDDWAKALQSAIGRAAWWLPGLWILGRALDLERELASDEHAAVQTGARRYAACLLRLATSRNDIDAVAPALWGRRSHVAIRVERLLRPASGGGPVMRAAALGAFTATAFAVFGIAVLAVPGAGARSAVPARQALAVAPTVGRPAPHRPAAGTHPAAKPPRHAAVLAYQHPVEVAPPVRSAPTAAGYPRSERSRLGPIRPARHHLVVAVPAARTLPTRPIPGIRPLTVEKLAFVATQRRCATCFGPLRSPDDGGSSVGAAFVPPAGTSATTSTIAVPDPTSGPVDWGGGMSWFRLPRAPAQL